MEQSQRLFHTHFLFNRKKKNAILLPLFFPREPLQYSFSCKSRIFRGFCCSPIRQYEYNFRRLQRIKHKSTYAIDVNRINLVVVKACSDYIKI